MKSAISTCYFGKHATEEKFILIPFQEEPERGLFVQAGKPITFPYDMGWSDLFANLWEFLKSQRREPDNTRELSEAVRRLKRNYVFLSVTLLIDNNIESLEVVPLHGKRGWQFESRAEEIKTIKLPTDSRSIRELFTEAFEIAS